MNVANSSSLKSALASNHAKQAPHVAPTPVRVRFDAFELDEQNALLLRHGKALTLAPRPFNVLCALARRPGSLQTKHTLLDDVWGHQLVSDSVLKTAVSELRSVLDDDPRQPRFIETVSRRGYRFIASTSPVHAGEAPRAAEDASDPADSAQPEAMTPARHVDAFERELTSAYPRPAYATDEDLRLAHELKARLRALFLGDGAAGDVPVLAAA